MTHAKKQWEFDVWILVRILVAASTDFFAQASFTDTRIATLHAAFDRNAKNSRLDYFVRKAFREEMHASKSNVIKKISRTTLKEEGKYSFVRKVYAVATILTLYG